MTFGQKLKTLRQKKDFNQTEVGNAVDTHYSHIGRYENDQQMPSVETLKKIANLFGVSVDYLINDETEMTVKADFEDKRLLEQFKQAEKLPEKERETIISLIDAYLFKTHLKEMVK